MSLPFNDLYGLNGLLFIGGGLLIFLGILWVASAIVPQIAQTQTHEDLAGVKFAMLEPLLGLALFFALGEAALHHHAVTLVVEKEISVLKRLSWAVNTLPALDYIQIHTSYDRYISVLTEAEPSSIAKKNDDRAGFEALQRLASAVDAAPRSSTTSSALAAARKLVDRASELRENRLTRGQLRTPIFIFAVAVWVLLLVFLFIWFFDSPSGWGRLLLAVMLCAAMLSVLFCVSVLYGFLHINDGSTIAVLKSLRVQG